MAQNLSSQTDSKLTQIGGLIGGAPKGKFPFNEVLLSAVAQGTTNLTSADAALTTAERTYRLAIEARRSARAALLASLSSAARLAEASSDVSDMDLVSIGLQPRTPANNRPRVPLAPTKLVAQAQGDGSILVSWKGQAARMSYVVETSRDGVEYQTQPPVTRQRALVPGVPGEAVWIRVCTSNAGQLSAPTMPVSIYAPVALRVEEGGLSAAA